MGLRARAPSDPRSAFFASDHTLGSSPAEAVGRGPVPSINSSALKYLNIPDNPSTLADHDRITPIGRANPSIDLQGQAETHPRKSRPSATVRRLEPFGQKATPHTL